MRTNYVLVDYESIQPATMAVVDREHFKTLVFIGANQTKVPTEFADALQRMGPRAEYVRISGNGPNALDFHIAFYIGQLAAADPKAYFHIVSNDTGFDPLLRHLKARKVLADRVKSIEEIPLVKTNGATSKEAKLACIITRLQQMKTAKPRTVKTLGTTISALFQKQIDDKEIESLIKALEKRAEISIEDNKVSYSLP
ncbi:MAG: hypothetical protein JJU27_00720 [Gammaproteobacteria bacterium]|nr:hypothetical protein [Gammaproteobacteria bacterium]